VLVNDIGIAMKRLGYALYGGKVYKKCDKAKYTYSYKCEVEALVNSLAANESFKARLLKDMKKVIDILANSHCEVIRPLCVDYNLIDVNDGKCWSIKERRFLENVIADKDIGHVTPRAFPRTIQQESQNRSISKKFWKTASQKLKLKNFAKIS